MKILGIVLFILFLYHFYQTKEGFRPLQNYCLSTNRTFIAISDPEDPRCIQNKKQMKESVQPILNYIPCKTENQDWGIQYLQKCFSIFQPFNKQNHQEYSGMNYSGMEYSGMEYSGMNYSGMNLLSLSKNNKLTMDCSKTRLPHSGPCFLLSEHFQPVQKSLHTPSIDCTNPQNLTLDQQCQCYTNDNRYGFYKVQRTGNQGSMVCRKYYKSNNNDRNLLGKYSPNDYQIYVPKKENSDQMNMTGCLPSDTDFNEMCAMQNKNQRFGTYKILYGEDGNCYDPISDLQNQNYGNAICSQNHYQNIPKLWSGQNSETQTSLDPNYFTKCIPMNSNLQKTFQNECDKIKLPGMPLTAYEIDSYDCLPGEARAKCKYDFS